MTRLAAGRTWNTATPDQRERFVSAFRAMLVRTYANAIDVYRGQTMMVEPARIPTSATETTVRNRYVSPGRRPTPADYLTRKPGDEWKHHDRRPPRNHLVPTDRPRSQATGRALGGTSVLIVVGVALDTMRQMESQMMMRNYEGFLK